MDTRDYATIVVTGPDALDFLQGQLTADLRPLRQGASTLAAWCNPKGRVICLFHVQSISEGFRLSLPADLADEVVKRMTMFRFRARVDFILAETLPEDLGGERDSQSFRRDELQAGIPEIRREQSEKYTPHMLNLDLLGAVSFDKGCYTGQEIVARTHYRGQSKRRLLRFESQEPVKPGNKVSEGEREIGEVLNAIGTDLLAVVPMESVDARLDIGGVSIKHVPLPYFD